MKKLLFLLLILQTTSLIAHSPPRFRRVRIQSPCHPMMTVIDEGVKVSFVGSREEYVTTLQILHITCPSNGFPAADAMAMRPAVNKLIV